MPFPELALPDPLLQHGVRTFQYDFIMVGAECPLGYLQELHYMYQGRPTIGSLLTDRFITQGLYDADGMEAVRMGGNFMLRVIENSELPEQVMVGLDLQAEILSREISALSEHADVFTKTVPKKVTEALTMSRETVELMTDYWKIFSDTFGADKKHVFPFLVGAGLTLEQLWRAISTAVSEDIAEINADMFKVPEI